MVLDSIKSDRQKNYKLTTSVAQIDWKISQMEDVEFCCCTATCKNKVKVIKKLSVNVNLLVYFSCYCCNNGAPLARLRGPIAK